MNSAFELLRILQNSLTEGLAVSRDVVVRGSLTAFFHATDSMVYMNYAVPNSEPRSPDFIGLIRAFRERDRKPRFEFFPDLWPGLESMLLDAGFECEMRAPLMALHASEFESKPVEGVELVSDADGYRAFFDAVGEAFGMEDTNSEDSVESAMEAIRSGRQRVAIVMENGRAVAGGCAVGAGPVVELAGVGTRPSHQRRGLAARISNFLCSEHYNRGGEWVWLSAGSETAKAVYERVGFSVIGEQLNYSMPD